MSQPAWKFLENLGDVNPLDYGGLFVFVDETGVYPAEMEKLDTPEGYEVEEPDDAGKFMVYRVTLDRCSFVDGVLSDNEFHRDKPAWFAANLENVCAAQDYPIDELRADLCAEEPLRRARAWQAVLDHHGWMNGDSDPIQLTRAEADVRYREVLDAEQKK